MEPLLGAWVRAEATAGDPFPDQLVFLPDGTYRGQKDQPGEFTLLDAGTYEVVGEGELALSTATDAVVTYGYECGERELTLVEAESGAEWSYRRAEVGGRPVSGEG